MKFPQPLVQARFIRREKRFLIHCELADGRQVIAHTNNTGRMSGCLAPDCTIWLSPADRPERKLKWTLEMVAVPGPGGGTLVGVNTALANKLVGEALAGDLPGKAAAPVWPQLAGYTEIKAEVPYGTRSSRADFRLLGHPDDPNRPCWVEVKNVTLVDDGRALFPDAPSERGRKHLLELADRVQEKERAVLVFCAQREDARSVGPADSVDPEYGRILREVAQKGVEVVGGLCRLNPREIEIASAIPYSVV